MELAHAAAHRLPHDRVLNPDRQPHDQRGHDEPDDERDDAETSEHAEIVWGIRVHAVTLASWRIVSYSNAEATPNIGLLCVSPSKAETQTEWPAKSHEGEGGRIRNASFNPADLTLLNPRDFGKTLLGQSKLASQPRELSPKLSLNRRFRLKRTRRCVEDGPILVRPRTSCASRQLGKTLCHNDIQSTVSMGYNT